MIPEDGYRITSIAGEGAEVRCLRLAASYHDFLLRFGLVRQQFLITRPDGSTLEVSASAASLNTADPHQVAPLLFLHPPLVGIPVPDGSYLLPAINPPSGA